MKIVIPGISGGIGRKLALKLVTNGHDVVIQALTGGTSFYAEDGDEWELFAAEKTNGRSAIAKLLALPPDPGRRFRLEVLDVIPLGRDAALVDAHCGMQDVADVIGRTVAQAIGVRVDLGNL